MPNKTLLGRMYQGVMMKIHDVYASIKFWCFFAASIAGVIIFVFSTFATNSRVSALESEANTVHNVVCAMSIDLKLPTATHVCRRDK